MTEEKDNINGKIEQAVDILKDADQLKKSPSIVGGDTQNGYSRIVRNAF